MDPIRYIPGARVVEIVTGVFAWQTRCRPCGHQTTRHQLGAYEDVRCVNDIGRQVKTRGESQRRTV